MQHFKQIVAYKFGVKVKEKIKITHITRFAKPHKGGIESFINMFNSCVSKSNADIEVLCCSNTDKSAVDDNGIFFNRAKYFLEFASNTISLSFLWKLSRVKTDVLIYHMPYIFAVICHFLARPKYKKMIVCYHSDIIGYDSVMKPFWGIYNLFLKKADLIHVQSPQMIENSMAKRYKDKCVMIPYLINTERIYDPQNVKKIKEQYKNKKIIFALGRHVKYKGFEYLIEAMKYVDNAVLLLGGEGILSDNLQALINKSELEDKIFMLGKIPEHILSDYYEACDIFVLPSISQVETFAVVQLEAMVHSKPIINTNLGTGVNYVSIDGETGLTVEPKNPEQLSNAINRLLKDDDLRINYGINARKRVEKLFDIKKIKRKYKELYAIRGEE